VLCCDLQGHVSRHAVLLLAVLGSTLPCLLLLILLLLLLLLLACEAFCCCKGGAVCCCIESIHTVQVQDSTYRSNS
jgi:hypothetical protein